MLKQPDGYPKIRGAGNGEWDGVELGKRHPGGTIQRLICAQKWGDGRYCLWNWTGLLPEAPADLAPDVAEVMNPHYDHAHGGFRPYPEPIRLATEAEPCGCQESQSYLGVMGAVVEQLQKAAGPDLGVVAGRCADALEAVAARFGRKLG